VNSVWTQQQKLTASDAARFDNFGVAVGVSGDTVLVGAYEKTINGQGEQGAAYAFNLGGASPFDASVKAATVRFRMLLSTKF
jgi:hypothetical protein